MPKKKKEDVPFRVNLACGQTKEEGWYGIDIAKCKGVDKVHNLLKFPWPLKSNSVDEAFCSHFFEHIPGPLRFKWMDELYRVLKKGAKCTIICPYYASMRAIQDPTHEWPPICEASFLYFNEEWRRVNKLDHYPVSCDFDFTYGYAIDPAWGSKSEEARAFGLRHYQHVVNDVQIALTKR